MDNDHLVGLQLSSTRKLEITEELRDEMSHYEGRLIVEGWADSADDNCIVSSETLDALIEARDNHGWEYGMAGEAIRAQNSMGEERVCLKRLNKDVQTLKHWVRVEKEILALPAAWAFLEAKKRIAETTEALREVLKQHPQILGEDWFELIEKRAEEREEADKCET